MRTRTRSTLSMLLIGTALIGCQSTVDESSSEYEALQDASQAYQAYERGDCETVLLLSEPAQLATWQATEVRHSTLLLHGFCNELAGDNDAAREIYEQLIEEAPRSFAAMDAQERSRILRITESDPTHAAWMQDARDRALEAETQPSRAPIERKSAIFPPLARTVGIQGYVVLEFGVTPRGRTSDPIVVESQPPLLFDGSAIRAIRRWRYAQGGSSSANDLQVIRLIFRTNDAAPDAGEEEKDATEADPDASTPATGADSTESDALESDANAADSSGSAGPDATE